MRKKIFFVDFSRKISSTLVTSADPLCRRFVGLKQQIAFEHQTTFLHFFQQKTFLNVQLNSSC
jgi:hypothetical protein